MEKENPGQSIMEAVDILKNTHHGKKIPVWFKVLDYVSAGMVYVLMIYAYYELIKWIVGR